MLLVGLSSAAIYRIALNKAAGERIDNLTTFFSVRLSELERDWELQTRDLRVRIEHTRILEQARDATPNLQAYLTIQGGGRRYTHLIVQDRDRQTLFAFGKDSRLLAEALEGKKPGDWLFDQASGSLYRVFSERIWLGERGTGTMLALFPVNNALLFQLTMPSVLLSALHHGQKIASSEGQIGLDIPQGSQSAEIKAISQELPWGSMDNNPTTLVIQAPIKGLFSTLELSLGVSAVPLLDGLILWFTLGIWLMANARRIKTLGGAVHEFSVWQKISPALREKISAAKLGKNDEINDVADAVEIMANQIVLREQERQSEEAERRLWSKVFEDSGEAIIITDSQNRIVAANHAFERTLGYREEEVLGKDPRLLASGHHDPEFYRQMWRQLLTDNHWQGEVWDRDRLGDVYPKFLSISAIRDERQQIVNYVGIFADITERKKSEQEMQRHREHLEALVRERTLELETAQQALLKNERLATLGQLTATVSHELRNPLAAMRPSLHVIKRKLPDTEEKALQAIERIERNITRCDHIIDELLDFTRIRDLALVPQELDSWLEGILAEQETPQGIRILPEFGLGELQVRMEPDRLRRAVINVFDNACHAMEERRAQETASYQPQLTVSTRRGDDCRVKIEFADNGLGMTEEVLARIFEPLFSTKGFGVGLGMPAVKQIMELHGGGVAVQSQAGQGTQITLWLPDIAATPRPETSQDRNA